MALPFIPITFFDIAIAMILLFLSSAAISWLTNKGPMLWPVLGVIPTLFFHISDVYDWVTDVLSRCGGTFHYRGMWFGRAYGVFTVDPAYVEYILKTAFPNFPKGQYYRDRFVDFLGSGIFNADGQNWKDQRRAATAEMHSARFANYSVSTIQELVQSKLLVLLERLAERSEEVDLQDVFLRFTFDNICTAAFGVDPGCLDVKLPEIEFAAAFEHATELSLFRFIVPPFVWKLMKMFDIGTERKLKVAIRTVHEFAEKTVRNRRAELDKSKGLNDRSDLLSRLMEAELGFSDKFLKDFCISFILAGRDTSSVALAWFFWLLDKNPHVERRILDEISRIVAERTVDTKTLVLFTVDELKKMEYLHAALSESLRLYPSVPINFKEVLEDDIFPGGLELKKGARVFYSVYSMGRNEGIWGKDCREFRPERWMKDGMFVSENQFKYAVFNGGPRLCIGKKFAYIQMKMVAASMLMKYHVEVVRGQEVVPKMTTTLYMKNGLRVTVKPRNGSLSPNI